MTAFVKCVPGKLSRDSAARGFYMESVHVDVLNLAPMRISDSQRDDRPQGLHSLGTVRLPYQGMAKTLPKSKVLKAK